MLFLSIWIICGFLFKYVYNEELQIIKLYFLNKCYEWFTKIQEIIVSLLDIYCSSRYSYTYSYYFIFLLN